MVNKSDIFMSLARRADFNVSVAHIQSVIEIADGIVPSQNIADTVNKMITERLIKPEQVKSIFSVLLIDKWKYKAVSSNITCVPDDAEALVTETASWNGVDLVLGYEHPDIGFIAINPKNPSAASVIRGFKKHELLLIFAGMQDKGEIAPETAEAAVSGVLKLLEKKSVSVPPVLRLGPFKYAPPKDLLALKSEARRGGKTGRVLEKKGKNGHGGFTLNGNGQKEKPLERFRAIAAGSKKISQLVSVPVSNELFHNGNVEAWKRIIRSYTAKYPDSQVLLFYDGERIADINTLFKWGKVKHGSSIQFAVAAEELKDLSKLSKYFKQGASPMFESFLRGSPDTVLNLF